MAECSVPGCTRDLCARGLCRPHYKRLRRRGSVEDIKPEDFFFARVSEGPDGCWVWDRPMPNGYGQFSDNRQMWLAHRWAYEFLRAEIPDGLVLDHTCRRPACVNPWHLEPVTQRVNLARSGNFMAARMVATHCIHGHLFDEANTYTDQRGRRSCKTCRRAADRRHYQSRRAVGAVSGD